MTVIAAAVLLVVSGMGDGSVQTLVHSDRTSGPARGLPQMEACPTAIFEYDWPVEEACRVAWCESRFDPTARNGASLGLFQIWSGWARHYNVDPAGLASDPVVNTWVAYHIWRDHGRWSAWGCSP